MEGYKAWQQITINWCHKATHIYYLTVLETINVNISAVMVKQDMLSPDVQIKAISPVLLKLLNSLAHVSFSLFKTSNMLFSSFFPLALSVSLSLCSLSLSAPAAPSPSLIQQSFILNKDPLIALGLIIYDNIEVFNLIKYSVTIYRSVHTQSRD